MNVWAESRFVVQVALGMVFLASTVGKLRHPRSFARGVAEYGLVSRRLINAGSGLIIASEGWLAISHLTGYFLTISLPIGIVMLGTFGYAVNTNLQRGNVLPCHCFGGDGETISHRTVARLLLLAAAEALLLLTWRVRYPQQLMHAPELIIAVSGAMLLIIGCHWLLDLEDLFELRRRTPGLSQKINGPIARSQRILSE
jgi:hypothetical protein